MLKNLKIRVKMAAMYVNMAIFTIPMMILSYLALRWLNQAAPNAGDGLLRVFTIGYPLFLIVYFLVTLLIGRKLARVIAFPLQDLGRKAQQLAKGDIDIQMDYEADDEIGVLVKEFGVVVKAIREQSAVLTTVAGGDYTKMIQVRSERDAMNRAINQLVEGNRSMILQIRDSAAQVSAASAQMSDAAQTLATGSSEQAATMQQFTASLEEVERQTNESNQVAAQTFEDTRQAGRMMDEGMSSMQQMTSAMQSISARSQDIAKVIKVIDDIAFQTNILALNAAVEAARAGIHGKGFAVVADEVRNLATKSADAAKETAQLIEGSVQATGEGNELAQKTNDSLVEVGKIAASNAENMQKLSGATQLQSQSIAEIAQGVQQINSVVQANAATAEQSAASAEEMAAQATLLTEIVSRFEL